MKYLTRKLGFWAVERGLREGEPWVVNVMCVWAWWVERKLPDVGTGLRTHGRGILPWGIMGGSKHSREWDGLIMWQNIGGGMKDGNQSPVITISIGDGLRSLLCRLKRPEGQGKHWSYFEVKEWGGDRENLKFFSEVGGSERRVWGYFKIMKEQIRLELLPYGTGQIVNKDE